MSRAVGGLLLVCLVGCGASQRPPAGALEAVQKSTTGAKSAVDAPKQAAASASAQVPSRYQQEKLPSKLPTWPRIERKLPAAPKGIAAIPQICAAYVTRAAARSEACNNGMAALDAALGQTEPAKRDAALVWAESCKDLPAGIVSGLRAELAPPACADGIVDKVLQGDTTQVPGVVHDTLLGLALAARLRRSGRAEPKFKGKPTREAVVQYNKQILGPWVLKQASAIQYLSRLGAKLRFYGRAIVGAEAGMADLRLVQAVRRGPIPSEFQKDKELRAEYQQSLELSLGPRKRRGRDAALVALGQLATVGVIRDPRVKKVRSLLGAMYGGRPIHALDALLLPPLQPFSAETPRERLAARLPTFYAGMLIPAGAALEASTLRALINRGLSVQHRISLRQNASTLGYDVRRYVMRARLELAQNYWRSVDVDEALAALAGKGGEPKSEADALLLAVAHALRGGPRNAAAMMVQVSFAKLGMAHDLAGLDRLAAAGGTFSGYAAFDAALLKQIAAPASAGPAYWKMVERRFRDAEQALVDIRHKQRAAARADECKAIAAAIGANKG